MANLDHSAPSILGRAAFAVLATLVMLICMTIALLGIKIWWFKHRLTFNHSSTSNGADGGARPAVQVRSRSNKEKRLSQEVREPVEVHGIFRKRQEDELDIVPTAHLPPVRVRISQSTPSLWLPKRKQHEVQPSTFENLEPPTREPPKPPMSPAESLPSLLTPTIDFDQASIFADFEEQFEKMEINKMRPLSMNAALLTPPNPAIGESGHKFFKAQSVSEPKAKKILERRPTGFVWPSAEDLLGEDEDRASSMGYIKYEEIDNDGLANFHEKWFNLKANIAANDPAHSFESYASERKSYQAVVDQHFNHFGTFKTAVAHSSDVESAWQTATTQSTAEEQNFETDNSFTQRHNGGTPQSQTSKEDERAAQLAHSILISKDSSAYEEFYLEDYDWKVENEIMTQCNVNFNKEPLKEHAVKEPTLKMRRTADCIRNDPQSWEDLEVSIGPLDSESRLWLEMERDVNQDFASNIDDEFNQIRNSYEENEGDFLETKYLQISCNDEDEVIAVKPKGFGKSIDEDWENFERLAALEPPDYKDVVSKLSFSDDENYTDNSAVTPRVPNSNDTDSKPIAHTVRRPTGYVRNIEEINDELDLDDSTGLREFKYNASEECSHAELTARKPEHTSILKERRPTSYVRSSEESLLSDGDVENDPKNEIFEPLEERKPNRRPKVTFDFNTTEHCYQQQIGEATHIDSEEEPAESYDETYNASPCEAPKPMQRMTKTHYSEEYSKAESSLSSPSPSPSPPALIFGTQISLETDMNDSWSAIRKRRFVHEELRQFSPEAAAYEPPKPAYRNPLAQVTPSSRVQMGDRFEPTPHSISGGTKPQPQSRRYLAATNDSSTTEA